MAERPGLRGGLTGWRLACQLGAPPNGQRAEARRATSPMIAASSLGRDHIRQRLVGRSTFVTSRSSARLPIHAYPSLTATLIWSDGIDVQMTAQRESRDIVPARTKARQDVGPRQGSNPESRNQDDRSRGHAREPKGWHRQADLLGGRFFYPSRPATCSTNSASTVTHSFVAPSPCGPHWTLSLLPPRPVE